MRRRLQGSGVLRPLLVAGSCVSTAVFASHGGLRLFLLLTGLTLVILMALARTLKDRSIQFTVIFRVRTVGLATRTASPSLAAKRVMQAVCRFKLIHEAIRKRALLEFIYHNRRRVVAPDCCGVTSRGVGVLRAVQVGGEIASGGPGPSKLFTIARISSLWMLDEGFRQEALHEPCARLSWIVDMVPGTRLRKRLQKMIADEAAHALELRAQGRCKAALWIAFCAWLHAIGIVLRAPFAALVDLIRRSVV